MHQLVVNHLPRNQAICAIGLIVNELFLSLPDGSDCLAGVTAKKEKGVDGQKQKKKVLTEERGKTPARC